MAALRDAVRELLTFVVVTVPRWVRELRWAARQDYVSHDWIREQRKRGRSE